MTDQIVHCDTRKWLQQVRPVNSDKIYFYLGRLSSKPLTLVVVNQKNGGASFFCEVHQMVYRLKDQWPRLRRKIRSATRNTGTRYGIVTAYGAAIYANPTVSPFDRKKPPQNKILATHRR